MSKFIVNGGKKLYGHITMQGSKNAVLPILAATVLCRGENIIHNCPNLSDVRASIAILRKLGCRVKTEGDTLIVNSEAVNSCDICEELMHEMRSSIIFLGAVLARMKSAKICFPGGCDIGARPIDIHIDALKQMGAVFEESDNDILCRLPQGKLKGANIVLPFPSVGATENIMITASVAEGETLIHNAAREPEVEDLARFLNSCGARIKNAGKSVISIEGRSKLYATTHTIIPDRIATTTYMSTVACTGGRLLIDKTDCSQLQEVVSMFEATGCSVACESDKIIIEADKRLKALKLIKTEPYPKFPTDAQALFMAMMCVAKGDTVFIENIFENRYKHTAELAKMGADIKLFGKKALVRGVKALKPAKLRCTDLRGGAALLCAGLSANGESIISDIHHIDRGYDGIEEKLKALGADIKRIDK